MGDPKGCHGVFNTLVNKLVALATFIVLGSSPALAQPTYPGGIPPNGGTSGPVVPYPFFMQPMQRLLSGNQVPPATPQQPNANNYYGNGIAVPPQNLPPTVTP
jgi:hypothetical protein